MPRLTRSIGWETDRRAVRVYFADRATTAYWNSQRGAGEPIVFCGWYWCQGNTEGGPFRSQSAATRDAYYRVVLRTEPPALTQTHRRVVAEARRRLYQDNRRSTG